MGQFFRRAQRDLIKAADAMEFPREIRALGHVFSPVCGKGLFLPIPNGAARQ